VINTHLNMTPRQTGHDLSGCRRLAGGRTHHVLADGGVVYKLWAPSARREAARYALLQLRLARSGICCPQPLSDGEGSLVHAVTWSGREWVAVAMPEILPGVVTSRSLSELGRQLARLHGCASASDLGIPVIARERVGDAISPRVWQAFEERVQASVLSELASAELGPCGLCHGDATRENVVFGTKRSWLIDFEHVRYAPVLLDVGRIVLSLHARFGGAACAAMLCGYPTHRVSGEEHWSLRLTAAYAALEIATWRLSSPSRGVDDWLRSVRVAVAWATSGTRRKITRGSVALGAHDRRAR
jgi:Ser/Thr protein kinase RdoA (MazF antagonist)